MINLYKNIINSLPAEYRFFLRSSFIQEISKSFGSAENFTEKQIEDLESFLIMYCVFVYTEDELIDSAEIEFGLHRNDSEVFIGAILNAFPDEFKNMHKVLKENISDREIVDEKLLKIMYEHQINTTDKKAGFMEVVERALVNEIPHTKLPEKFADQLYISNTDAMRITADVLDFLEPLSSDAPTAVDNTHHLDMKRGEEMGVFPVPAAAPAPAPTPDLEKMRRELEEAEALLRNRQPVAPTNPVVNIAETAVVPEASELINQATTNDSLLASGPGQQIKNPNATWNTTN